MRTKMAHKGATESDAYFTVSDEDALSEADGF